MKRILALAALSVFVASTSLIFVVPAFASDSPKSNIIDDAVFSNQSTMNESQIQNFINQFPNSCLLSQNMPNNLGTATFKDPIDYFHYDITDSTPAHIIFWASQFYHLNPQVILTTLEKEENLVTGLQGCALFRYNSAMGYNCPDSLTIHDYADLGIFQTCVEQSGNAGFVRQVSHASWQLSFDKERAYGNLDWLGDGATPYYGRMTKGNRARCVIDTNRCASSSIYSVIYYDGYTTIDGESVYLSNGATAALYNYTPHFTSFYHIFTQWFGSTYSPDFAAEPHWQQVYTDNTKTTPLGWNATLLTKQTAHVEVVMKNSGNITWTNNGAFGVTDTRLATFGPWGRQSAFCNDGWIINCTRPAALKEASVAPGEFGTFEFDVRAPNQAGIYTEVFSPIVDGRTVFSSGSVAITFTVKAPDFSAQPVWQQVYTDSSKTTSLGWNANLLTKQRAHVVVVMKNTGNVTWTKSGAFGVTDTRLSTYGPWGRQSTFCDTTWITCTRPTGLVEASVAPGQNGTFEFDVQSPNQSGIYTEVFSPVVDGRTVFNSGSMAFTFNVTAANFSAQPVWQQVYTNSSKTTAIGWNAVLSPNQTAYAVVVMKNSGNVTWTRSGAFTITDTRLATQSPWGRQSAVCDDTWVINCTRPATLSEPSVAPGQNGTFEFSIKAPSNPGYHIEVFAPIIDGRTVFSGGGVGIGITVQ